MMTAHSLTEVVWSAQMYLVTVYTIFAVLVLYCWQPEAVSHPVAKGRAALAALWCTVVVFGALMGGHLLAAFRMERLDIGGMTADEFISVMQELDKLDVYADSDYKVNLMVNALQTNTATGRGTAARCARELLATQEYDNCYHVAAYYYLPMRNMTGFFEAVQTGLAQERSNPEGWNSAFHLYRQIFAQLETEYVEDYIAGVLSTGELLDAANGEMMAPAELDEANQALLNCVRSLDGLSAEEAQVVLTMVTGDD
jgi:hypothetical protein